MRTLGLRTKAVLGLCGWLVSAAAAQSEPPAVFTDSQAADGKAAYESVCINCHADNATGRRGELGETPPVDSLGETFRKGIQQANGTIPPLAGDTFIARWGSRTVEAFSRRIATAIDGFPPSGLDDRTANNLAAYFLKVSGARPGARELGTPGTVEVAIRDLVRPGADRR